MSILQTSATIRRTSGHIWEHLGTSGQDPSKIRSVASALQRPAQVQPSLGQPSAYDLRTSGNVWDIFKKSLRTVPASLEPRGGRPRRILSARARHAASHRPSARHATPASTVLGRGSAAGMLIGAGKQAAAPARVDVGMRPQCGPRWPRASLSAPGTCACVVAGRGLP